MVGKGKKLGVTLYRSTGLSIFSTSTSPSVSFSVTLLVMSSLLDCCKGEISFFEITGSSTWIPLTESDVKINESILLLIRGAGGGCKRQEQKVKNDFQTKQESQCKNNFKM